MLARWQGVVVAADVVVDVFADDAAHSQGGRWLWMSLSMRLWGDVACSQGGRGVWWARTSLSTRLRVTWRVREVVGGCGRHCERGWWVAWRVRDVAGGWWWSWRSLSTHLGGDVARS